jgi:hypothetical protein
MAHVIEYLLCKHESLSLNPNRTKIKTVKYMKPHFLLAEAAGQACLTCSWAFIYDAYQSTCELGELCYLMIQSGD